MLGSALSELLHSLAAIPANERTPTQKALFEELALLCAASAAPNDDEQYAVALRKELRSRLQIENLESSKLTRPKPKGKTGKCPFCGRPLTAPTSSSV